jgi:WD40 repeat protein
MAFSLNDKTIVSGSDDKTVRLGDVASGAETAKLEGHSHVNSVVCSPDGKTVVSDSESQTLYRIDV